LEKLLTFISVLRSVGELVSFIDNDLDGLIDRVDYFSQLTLFIVF
jgi:hypothetical protein